MEKDLKFRDDLDGRHVLIVEDMIETGGTLHWLKEHLSCKGCSSVIPSI